MEILQIEVFVEAFNVDCDIECGQFLNFHDMSLVNRRTYLF